MDTRESEESMQLMEATAIMFIGNIKRQNGGLTSAVYRRANALVDVCRTVTICTFQYHHDFFDLLAWHREQGNLDPRVKVLNLYEPENQLTLAAIDPVPRMSGWSVFEDEHRPRTFRVFDEEGRYIRYEEQDAEGRLRFVDHFETPWTRVRKSVFDSRGARRQVLYMDRETNSPAFRVTYNGDGRPQISSSIRDGRPVSCFSHCDGVEYKSEVEAAIPWLGRIVEDSLNPILFVDKRELVVPTRKMAGKDVPIIFVLHNTHLDTPFDDPKKISPSMAEALNELRTGRVKKMVVLTEAQRKDVEQDASLVGRTVTIPHLQKKVINSGVVERNRNRVVSLARYHHQKDLDSALKVIALVRERIPGVTYDVFGYGPEHERLNRVVGDLGLEESVNLHSHTSNPEAELASSRAMLFTSRWEGFGLAPLEALACGTPVVSFDTKYGPSEIVRDGIDGFIVPRTPEQVKVAADRLVSLLSDDDLFLRMSENALQAADRFSAERFQRQWRELFQAALT